MVRLCLSAFISTSPLIFNFMIFQPTLLDTKLDLGPIVDIRGKRSGNISDIRDRD